MDDKWNRIKAAVEMCIADGDSDSLLADFLALRERAEKAEARMAELEKAQICGDCARKRTQTCDYSCRRDKPDRYRAPREALAGKGE